LPTTIDPDPAEVLGRYQGRGAPTGCGPGSPRLVHARRLIWRGASVEPSVRWCQAAADLAAAAQSTRRAAAATSRSTTGAWSASR